MYKIFNFPLLFLSSTWFRRVFRSRTKQVPVYNTLSSKFIQKMCSWKIWPWKINLKFFLIIRKKIWKKQFRIFFSLKTPLCHPWLSTKNFSPFGPAVGPAISDIYITNVLFYYKEDIFTVISFNPLFTITWLTKIRMIHV